MGSTSISRSTSSATPFNLGGPRIARGKFFVSFLPAISTKAAKAIRATIRDWRLASTRNNQSLEDLAQLVNPSVRGWMNYYGRFYRSKCVQVLRHLNVALAAWARRKYKRFRAARTSVHALAGTYRATGSEARSSCGNSALDRRLDRKSRMRREFHVRFCEGVGVQFPRATRLLIRRAFVVVFAPPGDAHAPLLCPRPPPPPPPPPPGWRSRR